MHLFKGSAVAIITPFNKDGVNFDKLGELIDWHIENKTDAIVICGTTGEASTMTEKEKKAAIKYTVDKVNKRIPVIAGTGNNNTAASIEMSKWAEEIGVDGVLIITPYYNKTTQSGLVHHFGAIAEGINIPIILYNVPSRTGMNILPSTLMQLLKYKNIVAIKEASGDISQVAKIKELCGDRLDIYSGNDDQIIPILSLGGLGVISVAANILPAEIHNICENYFNGDLKSALDFQIKYLSLINSLFIETNPIPIKTAMNLMNLEVGPLRLPLCSMEENNLLKLKSQLKIHGLI
ncbi:4-hydroxy-tetrahydrodipicolinate synthase [Clostridium sp. 19966]|uniref:4-hydroxy-tetrahydrodipicolinate synthase n=1 Tax=Clostridium sp. 19966 TaxID=2768166 RepID=UPI0028DE975C|nr:4-hydroxy-tetrahydrodipicolinate synthase [Clostridium sp. 19966]MDT8716534.1 4-hydroxy-tetrahydrodipicolinate synthase [Clostridium sp. 19966]